MIDLRTLPLLLLGSLLTPCLGQTLLRITDPAALVLRPDLRNDRTAHAGMQAAGLDEQVSERIVERSDPALWPIGLRTDSARLANADALRNMAVYRALDLPAEEGGLTVVEVPAKANLHMPEDMRSREDFYLVFRSDGLATPPPPARPRASMGPRWANCAKASIVQPDRVYATYDLADDEAALAAMTRAGMSQAEIEAVIFRSYERNWPSGIDSFDKRYPRLKEFKRYKAYLGAKWDDKVLVIIPAAENRRLPEAIRPYVDIYMVYQSPAVSIKTRK